MSRFRTAPSSSRAIASMSVGSWVMDGPCYRVRRSSMDPAGVPPTSAVPATSEAARSLLTAGEVIAGRFEVQALADWGGMGAVYRARDAVTGRDAALKL